MPVRASATCVQAIRDAAVRAREALVQQFIDAGRTPEEAQAVVDRYCVEATARLTQAEAST